MTPPTHVPPPTGPIFAIPGPEAGGDDKRVFFIGGKPGGALRPLLRVGVLDSAVKGQKVDGQSLFVEPITLTGDVAGFGRLDFQPYIGVMHFNKDTVETASGPDGKGAPMTASRVDHRQGVISLVGFDLAKPVIVGPFVITFMGGAGVGMGAQTMRRVTTAKGTSDPAPAPEAPAPGAEPPAASDKTATRVVTSPGLRPASADAAAPTGGAPYTEETTHRGQSLVFALSPRAAVRFELGPVSLTTGVMGLWTTSFSESKYHKDAGSTDMPKWSADGPSRKLSFGAWTLDVGYRF